VPGRKWEVLLNCSLLAFETIGTDILPKNEILCIHIILIQNIVLQETINRQLTQLPTVITKENSTHEKDQKTMAFAGRPLQQFVKRFATIFIGRLVVEKRA
jgi:hypothetical protein